MGTLKAFVLIVLLALATSPVEAQWSVGIDYQHRFERHTSSVPTNGSSLYLQRSIISLDWGDVFTRAEGSYWHTRRTQLASGATEIAVRARRYDVALSGGLQFQFSRLEPYVGVGAGYQRGMRQITRRSGVNPPTTYANDAIHAYMARYVGVQVKAPLGIRPFLEYRWPWYIHGSTAGNNIIAGGIGFAF